VAAVQAVGWRRDQGALLFGLLCQAGKEASAWVAAPQIQLSYQLAFALRFTAYTWVAAVAGSGDVSGGMDVQQLQLGVLPACSGQQGRFCRDWWCGPG
jgi:hypothetical protein